MAKIQSLKAAKREASGTSVAKKLRREGRVPAVIYGGRQENYGVVVDTIEIRDLLSHSASENILVRLDIEGAREQNKLALIQAVQHHPLTNAILHVDFHAVNEDDEIFVSVPVELVGDAVGVKQGGILDHQKHALEVRCKPGALPEGLKGDISGLNIGDALLVSDLEWPEGVQPVVDPETAVAVVTEIRVDREEVEEVEEMREPALAGEAPAEEGESEASEE